jgi:cell division GTPase FtsZ
MVSSKDRFGEFGWRTFGRDYLKKGEGDKMADTPNSEEQEVEEQPVEEQPVSDEPTDEAVPVSVPSISPVAAEPEPEAVASKGAGIPVNVAKALSPSTRKQAAKQVVVNDDFDYDVSFNMAFIGAGQGGGRMADSFYRLGYRRVAAFNTTNMDFEELDETIPKLSLDVGGAAKDKEFAAEQLKGREEEVWDLLTRAWGNDADYGLVCVGLGGGTGSGSAIGLVNVVRKYLESKGKPSRVGAVVSLPTVTEGQQVCRNAVTAFRELLEAEVSPLIIIDNARIHELYKPGMSALHSTANETVSQLFHLFNQLAAVHSEFITFDRSEFAQLLDSGIVVMGAADIGEVTSPADIASAIRDELTNNVLAEVELKKGKKGACLFVGHRNVLDALSLDFFEAGFAQLDRMLGSAYRGKDVNTVLHRGLYLGAEPGLQCYTMISDLEAPLKRLSALAKKGKMDGETGNDLAKFLGVNG